MRSSASAVGTAIHAILHITLYLPVTPVVVVDVVAAAAASDCGVSGWRPLVNADRAPSPVAAVTSTNAMQNRRRQLEAGGSWQILPLPFSLSLSLS